MLTIQTMSIAKLHNNDANIIELVTSQSGLAGDSCWGHKTS